MDEPNMIEALSNSNKEQLNEDALAMFNKVIESNENIAREEYSVESLMDKVQELDKSGAYKILTTSPDGRSALRRSAVKILEEQLNFKDTQE